MARTIKKAPPRPHSKEKKEHRHESWVLYRAKTRNFMAKGEYDNVLPFKGTSGWLTW